MRTRSIVAAVVATCALVLSGCSTAATPGASGAAQDRTIRVVAAENFWGSIAAQLGGSHAHVQSIIDNPDADPHDYEASPADARAVATADVVLVNGVGYDTWASRLAQANAPPGQVVLDVGDLVGAKPGDNPHRWYDPANVQTVVDAITSAYKRLDPADGDEFDRLRSAFETTGTADYRAVLSEIKTGYTGTRVGASESIFALVAPALGLDLVTPAGFLKAVSEGADPTASDKATIDRQIADHEIKVYVYNSQNATPDVQRQVEAATAAGIPVTTITETMVPADGTWQQWQTAQLVRLREALAKATGR